LYDAANRQLYFEAATNLETPLMRGLIVPVEASIAGWIVTERKPITINDAQQDPRHFKQVGKTTKIQTDSLLGVPMVTKDKVIGVLEAINKLNGVFTDEDQELLIALGSQAAVAIENARLFQQSDLISELMHELRTPLTSLNAAIHLLLHPQANDDQRSLILQTMQHEITRLTEMTTSFLDLARLESGRVQFRISRVELNPLVEECVRVVDSKAAEKGLNLWLRLKDCSPCVKGDSDKLKQVILNLLNNAINYTLEGGSITMATNCVNGDVTVEVKDTGIGIPPESLAAVFNKFYRVPGTQQSVQGTGLGLFICKRIVETHQGSIEVQSKLGEGTTFTVHLPASKE
jgi:signal transduction histidine kinase